MARELERYLETHPDEERAWELLVEAHLGAQDAVQARRVCSKAATRLEPHGGMGAKLRALCRQADERHLADDVPPTPLRSGRHADIRPARGRWWWLAVPATAAGLLVGYLIIQEDSTVAPDRPAPPAVPTDAVTFDFDSGIHSDASGRYILDTTTRFRGYEIPKARVHLHSLTTTEGRR